MSEELKLETPTVETPTDAGPTQATPVEVTPTPDPVESQARDQGWVSKEEWVESGRDESDWRPAKEFIDRGELYRSIHSTKRELKQTQAALQALQSHHKMVYEKAYTQALNDLKVQKRQAIRAGEFEQVEEIEDRIEQMQADHRTEQARLAEVQQATQAPSTPPEFQMFVDRNPWYLQDKNMRNEADAIGFVYLNNGGDKTQLLSHVEKEIKRKFPEKFGSVKRAAPNAVTPTQRGGKAPTKDDVALSDAEREVMRTFVRQGVMTEQQYKEELKKLKDRG